MKIKKYNEMSTNREKFTLENTKDNEYLLHGDSTDDFIYITKEHVYHDTEKGYSEFRIIIQRKIDGKFFECTRTDWSAGEHEYDFNCIEVFPKQITITKYE